MNKSTIHNLGILIAFTLLLSSTACSDLLDEKPDLALVTPTTSDELWALLDNNFQVMNAEPSNADIVSDDVYFLDNKVFSLTEDQFRLYTWSKEPINTSLNSDWSKPYEQVLFANVVLSELENFPGSVEDESELKNLKGAALFYRAYAFFALARSFCPAYEPATASDKLGLVLRISPEIDIQLKRSNLQDTFDQIINDLNASVSLLAEIPQVNTRPSKVAAYAMLSRVYLYMGMFAESLQNAELALGIYDTLLDYNTVDPSPARPFVGQLEEVVFYSELILRTYYFFSAGSAVSPELVDQYEENDLRKSLFYFPRDGFMAFRGQYSYLVNPFGGLAVDELYLNKAESEARLGMESAAIQTLNSLLERRFVTDKFEPVSNLAGEELIQKILLERRKELVLRGIRWGDIKRLNAQGEAIYLSRSVGEETFILEPGDNRFALPIPQEEIDRSGIMQNPN